MYISLKKIIKIVIHNNNKNHLYLIIIIINIPSYIFDPLKRKNPLKTGIFMYPKLFVYKDERSKNNSTVPLTKVYFRKISFKKIMYFKSRKRIIAMNPELFTMVFYPISVFSPKTFKGVQKSQ